MAAGESDITRYQSLEELRPTVKACTRCRLRQGAQTVVFGEGDPNARLMFIGEGPGAEEDRLGRPFVGAAGKLLDQMLAAMGFGRDRNVYIANVVKCRPPGNRAPSEDERAACRPHLDAQMRIINPAIVVLLGATAVQTLADPEAKVTKIRGQWIVRNGTWMMPTFHPAALLRNPSWKRDSWEDLKRVIEKYRELVDPTHFSPYYPGADSSAGLNP